MNHDCSVKTTKRSPGASRRIYAWLLGGILCVTSGGGLAGTLNLAESPLFLGATPDPNVMLLMDDTYSMDFQVAGDVSLLTGISKYTEVNEGTQVAFRCGTLSGGLLGLVQDLLQCLIVSEVDDGGLLGLGVNLNVLDPPGYRYAYLFEESDNLFPANDYTGGYLPVMLEEAFIDPALEVAGQPPNPFNQNTPSHRRNTNNDAPEIIAGIRPEQPSNLTANPNYRPPSPRGSAAGSVATGTLGGNVAALTGGDCAAFPIQFSMFGDTDGNPSTNPSTGYWRVWNSTYNAIAYNPNIRYRPWTGFDQDGVAFGNANPVAARMDPLVTNPARTYNLTTTQEQGGITYYSCDANALYALNGSGGIINKGRFKILDQPLNTSETPNRTVSQCTAGTPTLLNPSGLNCQNVTVPQGNWYRRKLALYPSRYYDWVDSDGDTKVDADEPHQLVEIRNDPAQCGFGALCPTSFTRTSARSDCAGVGATGGTCTVAEELQNYANWFQYYRRRELAAKAALTLVAAETEYARIGFAVVDKTTQATTRIPDGLGSTCNNNDKGLNCLLPVRAESLGSNTSAGTRRTLLDHIVRTYSSQGAAGKNLREGFDKVGDYYDCNNAGENKLGFQHLENDTVKQRCPILIQGGECQSNFSVMVTDGFWSDNFSQPYIRNSDNGGGNRDPIDSAFDGGAYRDSFEDTLADIAMHYYEKDLAESGTARLANLVPVIPGIDEARHQHLVSYFIGFGVNGSLTANPTNPTVPFAWPNPTSSDEAKIDDLRHAAYNGRGIFYTAKDPSGLVERLREALGDIADRASSASSVALNSGSLNTGTSVYQARFDSGNWTGQLLSFPVSAGVGQTPGCALEKVGEICPKSWDAAETLNAQNWDTARTVITQNSSTKAGVPFRWNNISTDQQTRLKKRLFPSPTLADDGRGPERVQYLRGNRTSESGSNAFRERETVLGDIINSDPFFVTGPRAPYDALSGYSTFKNAYKTRTPMVYVGANDGMLHGFRASDGRELLAYVPGDLRIYDDLPLLTLPDYRARHRYFVDGSPTIADAQVGGAWKSVLVSGLRRGGQSVFALDVTDPAQFSENNAASTLLWQFSDSDDSDLGYTYSRPVIVKMANGSWAAVIGNGYNSTESDGNVGSGEACLFILFLDGPGGNNAWNSPGEYKKICVTSGGPSNTTLPNGLASPAPVDLNGDFVTDAIYAGDLEGNLWRFDVSSNNANSWGVSYSGKPLFTACAGPCNNTDSNRQPITVRPEVGPHPGGPPSSHGVLVFFGTGKYIESGDNLRPLPNTQSFYMVYDQMWGIATGTPGTPPTPPNGANTNALIDRARLQSQTITAEVAPNLATLDPTDTVACSSDENCFRTVSNNPVTLTPTTGTPTNQGWYLDLKLASSSDNQGERNVSDPILRGDRIIFTTLIPSVSTCEFGGSGWLMELAFGTGGQTPQPPFDVNDDLKVDALDKVGTVPPQGKKSPIGIIPKPTILALTPESGIPTQGCIEFKYISGSSGALDNVAESCSYKIGRQTWRQIR